MSTRNKGDFSFFGIRVWKSSSVIIACGAEVDVITMSVSGKPSQKSENETAVPPKRSATFCARVKLRLVTITLDTPSLTRHSSVSSPMLPAPSTIPRRPRSEPKILRARSTAAEGTDAAPSDSRVSERTRPPTERADWKRRLKTVRTACRCPVRLRATS